MRTKNGSNCFPCPETSQLNSLDRQKSPQRPPLFGKIGLTFLNDCNRAWCSSKSWDIIMRRRTGRRFGAEPDSTVPHPAGLPANLEGEIMKSNSKHWGFSLVLLVFFFALAPAAVWGDLYWEAENVSTGLPGQPDGTRIVKHYYAANVSRTDMGDGMVMIMDFNAMTMSRLNTRTKTYTQMDMNQMGPPGMPAAQKERAGKVMAGMAQSMQVTPTGETKTINGYACKKFNVNFMMMDSEYWVSKDVKGYEELKSSTAKLAGVFEKNPALANMDISGMLAKLDGFPIQTTTHMMNGTMVTTVMHIEQKQLDPSLFKVPSDFTLTQR
jgi:hypothetical protein